MTTKQESINCKRWLFPSCPEINNPVMDKFKIPEASKPYYHFNGNDIDALNKFCDKCKKFEPNY